MNQPTVQRSSRIVFVLGAAVLWLAAMPAAAANLKDVRIGVHEKYTRIVLETDASAPCEIQSSGEDALVLRLNADSGAREIASKRSAHVTSVEVVPVDVGLSEIRVALRGAVELKKLVLTAPDRVVLDLSAAPEAGAGAPAAKPSSPPTPRPAAAPIPEPASGAPARKPDAPFRAPSEPAPVEPAPEEGEAAELEEEAPAPAFAEPDASAVVGAGEAVEKLAPGSPGAPALPRPLPVPPPRRANGGLLDALPAPLDQPLVLAGIAAALILVLAFVARRRRGGAAKEEAITPFAAGEPFSVDEKLGAAEEPAAAEKGEEQQAGLPIGLGGEGTEGSLFDQPVGEAEPSREEPGAGTTMDREEEAALVPPAGMAAPAPGPAQDLERRLAQLEERMEEVIDAKDRLGRQLAAQTEELRVQRAAIARTQRVLRDLSRPDDEPTEPTPKT